MGPGYRPDRRARRCPGAQAGCSPAIFGVCHTARGAVVRSASALVPLYLLHQFEVKAVAAMLGGYTYRYSMRDEERPEPVPAAKQRQALQALLTTLDAETLWPDTHIVALMSPRPPSYPPSDESFSGATGRIFDALRPVEEATSITMGQILQPGRAARLANATAEDPNALGLDEVLAAVIGHTLRIPGEVGHRFRNKVGH